jgi:hypothetical protein
MAPTDRGGSLWPPDKEDEGIWCSIETINHTQKATEMPLIIMKKFIEANFPGTKDGRPLRDGRILVSARTVQIAQKATVNVKNIYGVCEVKIQLMNQMNQKQGSIFGISLLTETVEVIKKELELEGVIDVERVNTMKNGVLSPNGLHILTFQSHKLPDKVRVGYMKYEVRTHYPRPLRCGKCCLFGHSRGRCTEEEESCRDCKETAHPGAPCSGPKFCRNCKTNGSPHGSFDKTCPTLQTEIVITRMKVDQNISYGQARQQFEAQIQKCKETYAQKVKQAVEDEAKKNAEELQEIQDGRRKLQEQRLLLKLELQQLKKETEDLIRMQQEKEKLMRFMNEFQGKHQTSEEQISDIFVEDDIEEEMEYEKTENMKRRQLSDEEVEKQPKKRTGIEDFDDYLNTNEFKKSSRNLRSKDTNSTMVKGGARIPLQKKK